jgi:hypothetical protein
VKFSKKLIPPQNNLTFNITISKGLAMPCANYTMMGCATNIILIPNHFATCEVTNKFVAFDLKR